MKASFDTPSIATPASDEARRFLVRCRTIVDKELDRLLPAETTEPTALHRAMRWSLLAGGKRLRPALVFAVGEAFGANDKTLLSTACAFELIHTYSLVHDDLPSMDDDDLRRGQPTCHIRFGEATAILAGDALQTLAFQVMAEDEFVEAETRVRLIGEITRAAGTPTGMVAGQCYDLAAESREVTAAELDLIHRYKTGAILTAAARSGAIIAGASAGELDAITDYGARLGLLFQITDDLLDVTASAADIGKTPGKDARAHKATFPALYGMEAARERALAVYGEACAALARIERPTRLLRDIAQFILERSA